MSAFLVRGWRLPFAAALRRHAPWSRRLQLIRRAGRRDAVMAWHVTISPSWFDPSTAPPQITPFGMLYAIHDALVRPYPGQKMGPSLAESWQESAGRADLRVQAASGPEVPQRRPGDDRGREVQLRALQGRRRQGPAGARRAGRDRRSAGGALSSQGAVARLHDVLRHDRHRRRHRRAEEVPRRRSATTASGSIRSAPAPTSSSATSRASRSCWRPIPATGAACRTSRRWS